MKLFGLIASLTFLLSPCAVAQFSPAFLQNDSYWGDGKSEYDLYDAQVMCDGQLRHTELQMVLLPHVVTVSAPADPNAKRASAPGPAIRLTQAMTLARGLMNEHRTSTILLGSDLAYGDFSIANLDGNVFRRATPGQSKTLTIETVKDAVSTQASLPDPKETPRILRQELPLRVRTLDFSKPTAEFAIYLTDLSPQGDNQVHDAPAKLSFKTNERDISVEIRLEGGGVEHITLDRDFPFLVRDWKTTDGSTFHLKTSLKVDYHKYLNNGDREKALKDPMLRHPD